MITKTQNILANSNWETIRSTTIFPLETLTLNGSSPIGKVNPISGIIGSNYTSGLDSSNLILIRKRGIKLIEVWNKILLSGFFISLPSQDLANIYDNVNLGPNLRNTATEFIFKNLYTDTFLTNMKASIIVPKFLNFIAANINAYNEYYGIGLIPATNIFNLEKFNLTYLSPLKPFINPNFKPNDAFNDLLNELLKIVLDVLDEKKIQTLYNISYIDLNLNFDSGKTNILKLIDIDYQNSYKLSKNFDIENTRRQNPPLNLLPFTKADEVPFIKDFTSGLLLRGDNTSIPNIQNCKLNISKDSLKDLKFTDTDLIGKQNLNYLYTSYISFNTPLICNGNYKYIDFTEDNDTPYILNYNAGSRIYLPIGSKTNEFGNIDYIPDYQLVFSGVIWKISHNKLGYQTYDATADIKLNCNPDTINKLDFIDNLTLFLKLN